MQKLKLVFLIITIGIFAYYIFINFLKEAPVQLRTLQNACGEIPVDYVKPDISSNPNFVFENDPTYQARQLFDVEGNTVFVNSFIECENYFSGGWGYFSQDYYLSNQQISCLALDKLKVKDLDNVKVYLKNIGLKEFMVDKNSLCMGSIQNKSIDGDEVYYEVLYSRASYIFISQIIPILFLLFFNLRWFKFVIILIISQIISQLLFNFYFGLNLINSVSLSSILAIIIIKLENKNGQHFDSANGHTVQ